MENSNFGDENTIILPVLAGSGAEAATLHARLGLPFALLVDSQCQVHRQLARSRNQTVTPCVYILDRADVIVANYPSAESATLPTVEELLAWVRYIELRCPE